METDKVITPEADQKYDSIFLVELKKRLKRDPLPTEIINADNDSDLVNETLWQLVNDLYIRIQNLEKGTGVTANVGINLQDNLIE